MSTDITTTANTIMFPRACTLCQSRKNVQLFAGLILCESCQENIKLTNPDTFSANDKLEQKAQD